MQLGNYKNIMKFQISSRRENKQRDTWVIKIWNNIALSDAEGNISRPFNRGDIANLPLLRTLLAIHQKSQEPSFREVLDSYLLLVFLAYANLAGSRIHYV